MRFNKAPPVGSPDRPGPRSDDEAPLGDVRDRPWDIWEFNPETVRDYIYRGKPATMPA